MSIRPDRLVLGAIVLGLVALEIATRRRRQSQATRDDLWLDLSSIAALALIQPLVLAAGAGLGALALPGARDAWAHWPWWAMAAALLLGDDLAQYLWHRAAHTSRLWPLHRAHHSARAMGIRITLRNNLFYYAMMPSLWIAGVLVWLGLGGAYAAYVVVKLAVILGAHCAVAWDAPLHRIRALAPLGWLLERTISTPATHRAHHALTDADGIGHRDGNFGNLLFVWDLLFGTAKITRRYPQRVGIEDGAPGSEHWLVELAWPLVASRRQIVASEVSAPASAPARTRT